MSPLVINLANPASRFIYSSQMDEPKFSAEYRAAFEKHAIPFWEDIFHIAHIKTRNRADAEELTQDTYVRAYQKFDTIEDVSRMRAWLASILHNLHIDKLKASGKAELVDQWEGFEGAIAELPQVAKIMFAVDKEKHIEKFLDMLSTVQRELIYYKYVKNLSYSEIAEMVGKNIGAVKTALAKARDNLRRMKFNI